MSTRHSDDPVIEIKDDEYMVLWRDSDTKDDALDKRSINGYSCLADNLDFNSSPDHPIRRPSMKKEDGYWGALPMGHMFGKRQIDSLPGGGNSAGVNLVESIGRTAGCPSTRRVALVGVATDCTYTGTFNSTQSTRANVISQMNQASSNWESSFNISLGLQNLTISDANCPGTPPSTSRWNQRCDTGADIEERLSLFSAWRGTLGDSNSHWTLLTDCNSGSEVGLAWLGQACVHDADPNNSTSGAEADAVTGANVVAKTSSEWQTISHETGHLFGAVHDCTEQTCADSNFVNSQQCCPLSADTCDAGERYIMNPFTTRGINQFSPCSIGNICSALRTNRVNGTCLTPNRGVVTINGQQCGNGIVESGEDCDCGGEEGCSDDPCCDARTCRFRGDAVCDDANEDCCNDCQYADEGTVCRASTGTCDPEETCSGSSGVCPTDETAPDGQSCSLRRNQSTSGIDQDDLACASGQCTSRDLQCRTVMSGYTQGNNDTYACDDQSCTMSCASPAFGENVCYGLQQNLLDGSPCGGGGHCANGECEGSSFGREVRNWIDNHRNLVIGLACGIGSLILLAIFSCCWSRFRRRKRLPKGGHRAGPNGEWFGPPPMGQRGGGPSMSGGRGSTAGAAGLNQPQVPAATHYGQPGAPYGGGWGQTNQWAGPPPPRYA
ncbi:MAG: hypothetical protein M1831_002312 [Alyxoria varia]|nr:MAG: hypothetical protein M1831_002312 [Alyxoria varia]